jgi:allantoate deiminase
MVRTREAVLPALDEEGKRDLARMAGGMLERLRRHGGDSDGSVTRLVYTLEWEAAMAEIEGWFDDLGLDASVNSVGSRFGRLAGERREVVLAGSHVDSVAKGGAYDGALGVIMATCAVGLLDRVCGRPHRSLEVLANCEEESSRFPGNFWGARAMLGLISEDEPGRLQDARGITVADAMRERGLDPARISEARRSDIAAFVEPHIEQGPQLEASGVQVGVVDSVVGVRQLEFSFEGSSGHAGTIPMDHRRDALVAAAELVLMAKETALQIGNGAVATVGSLEAHPGGSNQIAGEVRTTVDFRHSDESVLDEMEERLRASVDVVSARNSVATSHHKRVNQAPIAFDARVRDVIERSCDDAGIRWTRLPSGAGHDAQVIARCVPAGMLFVPSKGGHSHRPDEETDIADVVAGTEVLMRTLYQLAYLQ